MHAIDVNNLCRVTYFHAIDVNNLCRVSYFHVIDVNNLCRVSYFQVQIHTGISFYLVPGLIVVQTIGEVPKDYCIR
jgi:hypothetical protein